MVKPEPLKKTKQDHTRELIMEAALAEFSENGFQGARIDNVAKRAGRNKALVYRYFTDKDGLFQESMRYMFQGREQTRAARPDSLAEALAYWFQGTNRDPRFMRLIMQEALNHQEDSPPAEAAYREAYYQRQIDSLKAMQQAGTLPEDLDPVYLFTALTSLISWPTAFPQIVSLICGKAPSDEAFVQGYVDFLATFAKHIIQAERS